MINRSISKKKSCKEKDKIYNYSMKLNILKEDIW